MTADFTVKDANGTSGTIKPFDKITSIGGQDCEWYIDRLDPYASHTSWRAPLIGSVPVVIETYTGMNSGTFQPEFTTYLTVQGQPKGFNDSTYRDRTMNQKNSMDKPKFVYFQNTDMSQQFGPIKAQLKDLEHVSQPGNLFSLAYVTLPALSDADEDKGYQTPVAVSLSPARVNPNEQYEEVGGVDQKCGDAMFIVSRDQITESAMEACDYFTLSYIGQPEMRYTLWNNKGIRYLDTLHYGVYLERMK
jgi:hypothetical protein